MGMCAELTRAITDKKQARGEDGTVQVVLGTPGKDTHPEVSDICLKQLVDRSCRIAAATPRVPRVDHSESLELTPIKTVGGRTQAELSEHGLFGAETETHDQAADTMWENESAELGNASSIMTCCLVFWPI